MKKILWILLINTLCYGQTLKSEKLNFEIINNLHDLKNEITYSLNKEELHKLIKLNNKKFTLVLSYGFWCKPCNEYFPKILNFVKENEKKIELIVVNVEPDNSKRLYANYYYLKKRFNFKKSYFMISEEYGNRKWKKYDGFLIDLIGKDKFKKEFSGMSQNILFENNQIVYLSNYNLSDEQILKDLKNIIH